MERLNPQEISHQPTNALVLQGNRYSIALAGNTVYDSRERWAGEYDAYQITEHFSRLDGTGVIMEGGEPVLSFKISPVQKIKSTSYDSYKPEYLSEAFARTRDDAVDAKEYADAVAEHLLSLVQAATEQETISRSSIEPVWVTDKTGAVEVNLLPFVSSLNEYLIQTGQLPDDDGQFRLDT